MEVDERWREYLMPDHYNVPLHALGYSVTRRIGMYLDKDVEDTNLNGIIGNFGGLADLIGFDSLEIEAFERLEQKGKRVLDEWKKRTDPVPTVGNLVNCLLIMDREDILTDMQEYIRADVTSFLARVGSSTVEPVQDDTVTPGPGTEEIPDLLAVEEVMTGKKIQFDAYVCYNAFGDSKMDLDFVKELIARLESPPHNLRLFVPHRDDLSGYSENPITAKIIAEKCRHMIVVLSHNFLKSEQQEFQSNFAFSLSPAARHRRLVPVCLDDCPIPNIMRTIMKCDFTKRDLWDWSWNRLISSIKKPIGPEETQAQNTARNNQVPALAMSETNLPSISDSAFGSMTSVSGRETFRSRSPALRNNTAPVQEASTCAASEARTAPAEARPFTDNFSEYSSARSHTAPVKSGPVNTPSVSKTSGRVKTPSNSGHKTATSSKTPEKKNFISKVISETFSRKSKKPAQACATTSM